MQREEMIKKIENNLKKIPTDMLYIILGFTNKAVEKEKAT